MPVKRGERWRTDGRRSETLDAEKTARMHFGRAAVIGLVEEEGRARIAGSGGAREAGGGMWGFGLVCAT